MDNLFEIKRNELESFIREQMIGPNGCNGNFSYEMDGDTFEGEIINTTPGSIYSTAVLFPKKLEETEAVANTNRGNTSTYGISINDVTESNNGEDDMTTSDENEQNGGVGNDIDDEDVYSLNRRFPNTIGISCCLRPETDLTKDVNITVSGRYYTKIIGGDRCRVQVVIKNNVEQFEQFFEENKSLHSYFKYENGYLSSLDLTRQSTEVHHLLRSINLQCAYKIAAEDGTVDDTYNSIGEGYRFLLSYCERLFTILTRVKDNKYITADKKTSTINKIKQIEIYETFLSYFDDLMELFDRKSFGFWMSHDFKKEIDMSSLKIKMTGNKRIYKPSEFPCLANVVSYDIGHDKHISLSLWLQQTYNSKDATDKNLYLKVLLENTATPFVEDRQNYFSIVNEKVNQLCFFGIKIDIESDFIEQYREDDTYSDINNDEDRMDFLYRRIKDYGVGHLCSIDWEKNDDGKVCHVFSEFLPSYETPDIEPVPRNKYKEYKEENNSLVPPPYLNDNQCLQFKWLSTLSDATDTAILEELTAFVDTYGTWINDLHKSVEGRDAAFASANIEACSNDYERMKSNIMWILGDPETMFAFRLMNTAMFIQLWHNKPGNQEQIRKWKSRLNEAFYRNSHDDIFFGVEHAAWRPFQLAFILLNLDGIVRHPEDKLWEKRNEFVDLVWFPTGGGKTEAYFGIIAMSIIVRRRKYGEKGYGVSVIMRYTLRLLTIQQFQRALRLILALEEIRLWHIDTYHLGEEKISIGLYVGSNSLPNKADELHNEALKWLCRKEGENNTKIPLDRCPWCGELLTYEDHEFCCKNEACIYSESIPVKLCDEDIYKNPPTLLFGTVDKFAAIAHKVATAPNDSIKDSRRLFGKRKVTNVIPPDLIIQDELHLLLGPLGSAVSLFECAIDILCSRIEKIDDKDITVRPKIISSTATTRNTDLQIRALYDRNLNIFPKNGVDYDDSFFAFYKRSMVNGKVQFKSKRKYIGIMPTGRTQMTTQMRLAAILLVHRAIFEISHGEDENFESVADNYYSVISYFNSLKEVGKTDAQFYIEYTKYLRRLYRRVLRHGNLMECFYANDLKESEISGRLSGEDVNRTFGEVAMNWKITNRLPHKLSEGWVSEITPPDYILATNMISVGLDVGRFNTIIMNSMPRNIAEYIQASSRVARSVQGLVLTLHNPFRSRDVSHYEKFREFHEKLYYYVEPISITPFSKKSVDKYISLYMAAVIRHSFDCLADRNGASRINNGTLKSEVCEKVMNYFNNRCCRTEKLSDPLQHELLTNDMKNYVAHYVEEALEQWASMSNENLVYENAITRGNRNENNLFTSVEAYDDDRSQSLWTVPTSLRIVEPEAVLHVKIK